MCEFLYLLTFLRIEHETSLLVSDNVFWAPTPTLFPAFFFLIGQ